MGRGSAYLVPLPGTQTQLLVSLGSLDLYPRGIGFAFVRYPILRLSQLHLHHLTCKVDGQKVAYR